MERSWQDPPPQHSMPQMMLPRLTPVTRRLLLINGAVFLLSFVLYLVATPTYKALTQHLGLLPSAWRDGFPLVPIWQPLTYGFLHSAEDLMHIIGNMLMLYFFGTMLEEILGSRRFFIAYIAAQLLGAAFFVVPGVFTGSNVPAIGASGAVYGIMTAMATLRPRQQVFVLFIPITLKILALGILGLTVFSVLLSFKHAGGDNTAHLVHLGGIAYGFLAVRTGLIAKDPVEIIQRRRAVAQVEQRASDEERMDQLLEKISREGMASLSHSERDFLRRVSTRK